jgi:tRNA threonylcarbamoyladenosine biosynthesis protein TsaE
MRPGKKSFLWLRSDFTRKPNRSVMSKKTSLKDTGKNGRERGPAAGKPGSKSGGPMALVATTQSEEETFELAKRFARQFKGREVVLLSGELGAGKTIFAKGIAAGLGMKNWALVCSPSFTIMNIYEARYPIFHFDLYRLEKSDDILDLGWEDYLDRGVVIVEWGERIPFELAAVRVDIRKGKGDKRTIEISRQRP